MTAKKKAKKVGRPPVPADQLRIPFTIRVPQWLADDFRAVCAKHELGTATNVLERCMANFIARQKRRN